MLIFDAAATEAALSMPALLAALRQGIAAGARVPLRHVHGIEGDEASGTSLIMPAWSGRYYGVKIINIFPDNAMRGLPGLHGVYALFDATSGVPLALVDADVITAWRTAAAAALAADHLAGRAAKRLLVVGSGRVARLLPKAMSAVRSIEEVSVRSRTAASAHTLADALAGSGVAVTAVTDLEAAARAADIISCATLSTAPIIRGEWLKPGAHLDLIGSFTPQMREADGECFKRGRTFVDTHEAPMKSGDLLSAMEEGCLTPADIFATLQDLVCGLHPGREDDADVTVFKAVGSALEDLVAAQLVFERNTSFPTYPEQGPRP